MKDRSSSAYAQGIARALRLLIGVAAFLAGVLVGLWGLFFTLYRGDEGSTDVYIGDFDAQVVGVVALAVGLIVIWVANRSLRRLLSRPPSRRTPAA